MICNLAIRTALIAIKKFAFIVKNRNMNNNALKKIRFYNNNPIKKKISCKIANFMLLIKNSNSWKFKIKMRNASFYQYYY